MNLIIGRTQKPGWTTTKSPGSLIFKAQNIIIEDNQFSKELIKNIELIIWRRKKGHKVLAYIIQGNTPIQIYADTNIKQLSCYQNLQAHIEDYYHQKEANLKAQEYERYSDINIDESLVRAFQHLYDLDVDYTDPTSVAMNQKLIEYYLDNDIEYSNEISGIEPEHTPFEGKFKTVEPDVEVIIETYGDLTLLEDTIYKARVK